MTADEPATIVCDEVVVEYDRFLFGPMCLSFGPGEIAALVGPNGSGKTTLLRAMLGLVRLASGGVRYGGAGVAGRPARVLRGIGYVPDGPENLLMDLTASEFWELHAMAHARVSGDIDDMMRCAGDLAEMLELRPGRVPIGSFSHGMQKKTQIVAGMLHRPRHLIFDEPRNGLDPIAIETFERLMLTEVAAGCSLIVATHDLRFAARVADKVAVLHQGRCVAHGSPHVLGDAETDGFVPAFMRLVGAAR
jgi:ABC-2 type transport system ATP-binding protein